MSGIDTIRGINYQHGQAVARAIESIREPSWSGIRVEAANDAVDLEILDNHYNLVRGEQYKTKSTGQWSRSHLLTALRKWGPLPEAANAEFAFITDGDFGPSARELITSFAASGPLPFDIEDLDVVRGLVSFRQDSVDASTLFDGNRDAVLSLLPHRGTGKELSEQARTITLEIYHLVSQRSGVAAPGDRFIDRIELCTLLGVDPQLGSLSWSAPLVGEYVSRISHGARDYIDVVLRSDNADAGETTPLAELLAEPRVSLIYGVSGTGKSICAELLRVAGASAGRPVLRLAAEGYIPGRLGQLIAYELEQVLAYPVPSSIAYDVWNDPGAVVVIDGVSEVDAVAGRELAAELRQVLLNSHGAQLVLIGRDVQRLKAATPRAITPSVYTTLPWSQDWQRDLIARSLHDTPDSTDVDHCRRQLASKLGTGMENPYLLKLGLIALAQGRLPEGRSPLYRALLETLAEEQGILNLDLIELGLGVMYSTLLDDGRRYGDLYEWQRLCGDAANVVGGVEAEDLDRSARMSGIVVPVGVRSRLVPLHDSIADYLAARAAAAGLVAWPEKLMRSDAGRLEFFTEAVGLPPALLRQVAAELPFELVRLGQLDTNSLASDALPTLALAVGELNPMTNHEGLVGWQSSDGSKWVGLTREAGTTWLDFQEAQERRVRPLFQAQSPAAAAVAIWRHTLETGLATTATLRPRRPRTLEEACDELRRHAEATIEAEARLIETLFSESAQQDLGQELSRLRIEIRIGPYVGDKGGIDWYFNYRPSSEVVVGPVTDDHEDFADWGSASIGWWLSKSPAQTATANLRKTINERTIPNWL